MEYTDYEKEKRLNDLQRATYIYKTMNELTADLMVCKCMYDYNPKEAKKPLDEWKIYLEDFKKEIDNLYERVSNRKTRGSN